MNHPLTDEMILEIMDTTGVCDPAYFGERHPSPEEMRAAADWQLEQVIDWLKEQLITGDLVSASLKKAMRPQEDN